MLTLHGNRDGSVSNLIDELAKIKKAKELQERITKIGNLENVTVAACYNDNRYGGYVIIDNDGPNIAIGRINGKTDKVVWMFPDRLVQDDKGNYHYDKSLSIKVGKPIVDSRILVEHSINMANIFLLSDVRIRKLIHQGRLPNECAIFHDHELMTDILVYGV